MNDEFTPDEREFIDTISEGLPPIIARDRIEKLTGGLCSRKTLANYDAKGMGPEVAFSVGRRVAYKRDSFLQRLIKAMPVRKLVTSIKLT